MCTVTFIPLANNDFILTSSRDVPFARKPAMAPKKYLEDGVELYYPKDGEAGGSWIGTSNKNRLICLLNGGFKNHEIKNNYKQSRGIVVKEILKKDALQSILNQIDLTNIEPFTIVALDWNTGLDLVELVWDGNKKHIQKLLLQPKIWSSSTLYSDEVKELRELWFKEWQKKQKFYASSILEFHHYAGIGDPEIDVMMRREKGGTVSITQVVKKGEIVNMYYEPIKITVG